MQGMTESFIDLLEGLHRWCGDGQEANLTAQLVQAQRWLAKQLPSPPVTQDDWLTLWRTPLEEWWPVPLPDGWGSHCRLLSRHESTLTAEALTVLETYRPEAFAAALPEPPGAAPASVLLPLCPVAPPPPAPPQWNLQDLVTCVIREVSRRERVYTHLVHQHRMTPEEAERELSQMRAVKAYLLAKLQEGVIPEQQVLF
jgi:hypothetical protein